MNEDKEDTEKDLEDIDDTQDQVHEVDANSQGPDGEHTPIVENQAQGVHLQTKSSGIGNVKAVPYLPVPIAVGNTIEIINETALPSERAQEMERLQKSVNSENRLIQEV